MKMLPIIFNLKRLLYGFMLTSMFLLAPLTHGGFKGYYDPSTSTTTQTGFGTGVVGSSSAPNLIRNIEPGEEEFEEEKSIPEVSIPAAIWLFGTALVGFIGISRRRKIV